MQDESVSSGSVSNSSSLSSEIKVNKYKKAQTIKIVQTPFSNNLLDIVTEDVNYSDNSLISKSD